VSCQLGGLTHQQILHKISAYRAAQGATHHAAHGTRDRQGLSALFGLAKGENFQRKTGQRRSAANFLPAQERQHKTEAAIAHGVSGGRRDHQGLPVLLALFDKSQGKPDRAEALPIFFCRPKNASIKRGRMCPWCRPLRMCEVRLWQKGIVLNHSGGLANLLMADSATICIAHTKNSSKGVVVHHEAFGGPICPVAALA
jgi:hypothetical protein